MIAAACSTSHSLHFEKQEFKRDRSSALHAARLLGGGGRCTSCGDMPRRQHARSTHTVSHERATSQAPGHAPPAASACRRAGHCSGAARRRCRSRCLAEVPARPARLSAPPWSIWGGGVTGLDKASQAYCAWARAWGPAEAITCVVSASLECHARMHAHTHMRAHTQTTRGFARQGWCRCRPIGQRRRRHNVQVSTARATGMCA